MEKPKVIVISEKELKDLQEKIHSNNLNEKEKELICNALQFFIWLKVSYEKQRGLIHRLLHNVFGSKTEKKSKKDKKKDEDKKPPEDPPSNTSEKSDPSSNEAPPKSPPPGHGRYSSQEYKGSEEVICNLNNLKKGDTCPECQKGKVYSIKPGILLQMEGQAPLKATQYIKEKLRCNLCGEIFEAPLPDGVSGEKWTSSAKATTSVLKYAYGMPHFRQEKWLRDEHLPLSDATLFEQSEKVADAAYPIVRKLEEMACQSEKITHLDDTTSRVLELMKENKAGTSERKGIYTTIIKSDVNGKPVFFFKTGRKNAGENLDDFFKNRNPQLSSPRIMVDGSSSNYPETLTAIIHNCLTHARREFIKREEDFPSEAKVIINLFGKIYWNDENTKKHSDEERLEYHKKHSQFVVDELYKRLKEYEKTSEPNGELSKALQYVLKRWDHLFLFLSVPGAPLDNNIAERIIKTFVIYRKNSYFYKTQAGAWIGYVLMSIIQTCRASQIKPIYYLTKIQDNMEKVRKTPEFWFPWNFEANIIS